MTTYFTVGLFMFTIYCLRLFLRRQRKSGEPPLKHHSIPFVGYALDFGKDPEGCLKELQKTHGNVFTIQIAGWNYHVFTNPFDVVRIEKNKALQQGPVISDFVTRMVGEQHSVHQDPSAANSSTFFGRFMKKFSFDQEKIQKPIVFKSSHNDVQTSVESAITTNLHGSVQLQKLFGSCVRSVATLMRSISDNKIAIKDADNTVNLNKFCAEIIFHISFTVIFGSLPDEDEDLTELNRYYEVFSRYNKNSALLVDRIPIYLLPEVKKARKEIFDMFKSDDWTRRKNRSQMIEQVLDVDRDLEHQIRHMLILLWSSQANTIPGFFWMLFHVLSNPDVRSAIVKEFDEYVNDKTLSDEMDQNNNQKSNLEKTLDDISKMTKADLDKLYILDSTFKEMTRLSGSSMVIRRAIEDTTLTTIDNNFYRFRKGDYIMFYSPLLHYDDEVYQNPSNFKYDRYLDNNTYNQADGVNSRYVKPKTKFYKRNRRLSSSNTIMTFGVGQQRCPGRHLASIEIKLLTLALLKCFDVSLVSDVKPTFNLTHLGFGIMPPKEDIFVRFSKT